jgi:hypothetical protein
MTGRWLVRPMNAIPVYGAGTCIGEVPVPDLVGVFGQRDAFELPLSLLVKQTELNLRGIR